MDLDAAYEAAVGASDEDPGKVARLGMLAVLFNGRYISEKEANDLDNAISAQGNVVRLTPDGHPEKTFRLGYLGELFTQRFIRLGNLVDINKSISVQEDVMRLTPDGHPLRRVCLTSLGVALRRRFERLGILADIDRSTGLHEDAVRLTPDTHWDKAGYLSNLNASIMRRFERFGNLADLDKAIAAQEAALQLTPDGHFLKPICLNCLGMLFKRRFEHLGNISDIDRSITLCNDAVRLSPDSHADKYSYLVNLGASLLTRFHRLGNLADLNKSIALREDVLQLIPDGHPDKSVYLSHLSSSLLSRFDRLGDLGDLERSIGTLEDALRLTPDGHPDKPMYMNNLGRSLLTRFQRVGNLADVDKSVALRENAVQLTPDGHPDKPDRLDKLGCALRDRFLRLENVHDIDHSIKALEDAVRLCPVGHPDRSIFLGNLGGSYMYRFWRLEGQADLDNATIQFSRAARSSFGHPLVRFHAASGWAGCSLLTDASSSLEAYGYALDILPRVAWLGLPIAERHRELTKIGGIARDAAAAAIQAQEYETALEWLEQGRSIVWGQLLHLRTPMDDLHAQHPALADRLDQISKDLEHASTRDISTETSQTLSLEQISQKHRRMADDYTGLVEDVRALPGFEEFLQPNKLAHFRSAARSGPVVVININSIRCDALILRADPEKVMHIPLDGFSQGRAEELQQSLDGLLSGRGLRARSARDPVRDDLPSDDTQFMEILSEIWVCVVKPVLERLAFPISDTGDPPRIWWCPTGALTFLPLHAAGHYDMSERGHKLSDFVVSSYTPTLTALLDSPRTKRADEFKLLAISQPFTPGQSSLPNTTRELNHIRRHADQSSILSLEGAQATVERVIESMKQCDWIHLACHGTQDISDPTKSAFLLQNGQLELAEIIKTPLPNAEFAFLSACKTATGDKRLSEEAVHLAAGMLLAGYRGVIATTWSIMDNDAPLVADEVYARLFKDHPPNSTQAALALHHAVERLREQRHVSVFSWVPFIHVGM